MLRFKGSMKDFSSFRIDMLEEVETHLHEGRYHEGEAIIIRMLATKL